MPFGFGWPGSKCRRCDDVHGAFAADVEVAGGNDCYGRRKPQLGARESRGCGGCRWGETVRVPRVVGFVVLRAGFPVVVTDVNGRPRMIQGQVQQHAVHNRMPRHRGNE